MPSTVILNFTITYSMSLLTSFLGKVQLLLNFALFILSEVVLFFSDSMALIGVYVVLAFA